MIACIVLTAGESSRFCSPKALADWQGSTVLEGQLTMLQQTQVGQVIVVTGAHQDELTPLLLNHRKVTVVHNKDYKFGQTSSFQQGLTAVNSEASGVFLLPVDYPAILSNTIDGLIDDFRSQPSAITIPTYKNVRGHPPLFSSVLKDEFLSLDPQTQGLNVIAHQHTKEVRLLSVSDEGVIQTFNTQDELEQLKKI